jgi:hypothetical protein
MRITTMRIIKKARVINDFLIEIDGVEYDLITGKHSFYVPGYQNFGLKITNSHNGKIEPFKDWSLGKNSDDIESGDFNAGNDCDFKSKKSIISEYLIMKMLSEEHFAPEIGETIYIENFISDYPYGYQRCDSMGRYGYMMKDASKAIPVERDVQETVNAIRKNKRIKIPSKGTIGDVLKENNLVNGYLIDIRRTIWDMMYLEYSDGWFKKKWKEMFEYKQDKKELKKNIKNLTQFPHKERDDNYQTYFINGKYENGSRNTIYRFDKMGIGLNLSGKSIVDLGCNLGSIAMECWNRGARIINAYDCEKDYIDCARDLTRYNKFGISFISQDLIKQDLKFDRKINIVFALSIYKHMKEDLLGLLNTFEWGICYFESNACSGDGIHEKEIEDGFKKYGWDFEKLGYTEDRNKRAIWRLIKLKF